MNLICIRWFCNKIYAYMDPIKSYLLKYFNKRFKFSKMKRSKIIILSLTTSYWLIIIFKIYSFRRDKKYIILFREINSINWDIALYMQVDRVRTPIISFIHLKGGNSNYHTIWEKNIHIIFSIEFVNLVVSRVFVWRGDKSNFHMYIKPKW
jgi:hypothetical protein